jgi:hypothetical protein
MVNARDSHGSQHGKILPQALIENPGGVREISPGSSAQRDHPGYRHCLIKLDPEGVARAQTRARLTFALLSLSALLSHPKSTLGSLCGWLIRVENSLSPTCYRPIIRPENKGIKPFTNRHKPKNRASGRSRVHHPCESCNPPIHQSKYPLILHQSYPSHVSYLSHPFLFTGCLPARIPRPPLRLNGLYDSNPSSPFKASSLFTSIQAFLPPGGVIFYGSPPQRWPYSLLPPNQTLLTIMKKHWQ